MAQIKNTSNRLTPLTIKKFLGLNIAKSGDTQLLIGESGNMDNCYITKDYGLSKIMGYLQLMTLDTTNNIQGMWYGNIGGTYYFLYAENGHVYRFTDNYWVDDTTWGTYTAARIDLGTLTDAKTNFFAFGGNVYIQNGYEYKKWNGTGSITDVAGYIPKIRIACAPLTGAGTEYEQVNVLTGKKRLTYKADGTAIYTLPETSIGSVDSVYVLGVLQTLTTQYTVVTATGKVTFTAGNIPVASITEDEVEIYYTKGVGSRDYVLQNRHSILFGEATDTRVFLYAHRTTLNQRIFSLLADGIPSAEYFTEASIDLIGSAAFSITSMERQQSIMLIHKQNETYYSYYDVVNLDGIDVVNFPAPIINNSRGNVAFGQGQVLNNDPFTIDTTLIKWVATTVKDERNMKEMGIRIQRDLNEYDLSDAITVDWQERFEMWIAIGKKVWVYNYNLDLFYRLDLEDTVTSFIVIDGDLYFGTVGKIMKFSDKYLTFNAKAIDSHWEANMYNFGADYLTKTLNNSWITLSAQSKVSVDLKYITDRDSNPTVETKTYEIITFDDIDFGNFSFATNFNPQPFRIRLKSKKFVYLKLVLDNIALDTTFTVLGFTMQVEYGGNVK